MIAVVYANRAWICALYLMPCRMSIGMLCSIIYVDASDCIVPYRLCIDRMVGYSDILYAMHVLYVIMCMPFVHRIDMLQ